MKKLLPAILILSVLVLLIGCHADKSPPLTVTYFDTPEEMVEYFSGQLQKGNSGADSPDLFVLGDSFAGLELDNIKLSGAFLYYKYVPAKANENQDIPEAAPAGEDDPQSYLDHVSIGWNKNGHGSDGLAGFVEGNSRVVKELLDYPGFYYSDCVAENGTLFGKMLYWVQEDCFFQAAVPIGLYEEALAELTSSTPALKKVQIENATE